MSWLQDYLDYTAEQESPEVFHFWSGVTGIASVLSRHVWLPRISKGGIEYFKSYPGQIMTVLVAGSGKARKSSAIDCIEPLIREAGVRLFTGKITPERVLSKLASFEDRRAIMTIVASELSVFLSRQQYAEPMINILTKLSDSKDDEYETQAHTWTLKDVCVTMLCASTPASIGKSLPPEAHEYGFQSRFLWPYSGRSGKVEPLSGDSQNIDQSALQKNMLVRARLIEGLREMSRLRGEFRWEPEAREWFNDEYSAYMRGPDSEGEGWPTRKYEHIARVGMVLSVSEKPELLLRQGSLIAARVAIEAHIEANFDKTFEYIGRHANADQLRRIVRCFPGVGTTLTSDQIYDKVFRYFQDLRTMQLAMQGLQEAHVLKRMEINTITGEEKWVLLKEWL